MCYGEPCAYVLYLQILYLCAELGFISRQKLTLRFGGSFTPLQAGHKV